MFSCEFCEISKNIFSYRTTPVAASESKNIVARIMTYMLYICVFFEENFFFAHDANDAFHIFVILTRKRIETQIIYDGVLG